MITSWHSFPKVWSLGHGAITELFYDEIHGEEKIDGSQFSFGVFSGELKCKSKNKDIVLDDAGMFENAVQTVKELLPLLKDGWTYRAEYLGKPKHNVLAYSRTPEKYLILFDVNIGEESYLDYNSKAQEATRLGLEVVPLLYAGDMKNMHKIDEIMEGQSVLGGQKIEGIVFKNYKRFGVDKKVLMGKFVSERFKEKHRADWKISNPKANDILALLKTKYRSEVRWEKSVQHLKESGVLTSSPKDIGGLLKEVRNDCLDECKSEIMVDLFNWAWPQVERSIVAGLPEWYKRKLAETQFKEPKND